MMRHFSHTEDEPANFSITEALRLAKLELDCAYSNLNHVTEPDLIDCYIYQLKSAQLRYCFLLNCAKKDEK